MIAIIGAIVFLVVIVLSILIICGLPLGELTMGGKYKVFPKKLRFVLVAQLLLQIFFIIVILQLGGFIPFWFSAKTMKIIGIVMAAYLSLNTIMNFISKSKKEKHIMTPLSVMAAACFWITALTFSHDAVSMSEISYTPVVCEYSSRPACGWTIEFFSTNIKVMDNNTVEVYCSDFKDNVDGEEITVDYIYGETFEITEKQKQELVDVVKENRINILGDCSASSHDGSYNYIKLFDKDGECVHSCGGLNPSKNRFVKTEEAIFELLPEDVYRDIREKAEDVLLEYLLEKYPGEYEHFVD